MTLASPDDLRAAFGAEEIAHLTALHAGGDAGQEDATLAWALMCASGRALSYVAARYPLLAQDNRPEGLVIPPALKRAICDIARYYLTGTAVQETDPIATRYKDAIAWLKELAAGEASLPGLEDINADLDGDGEPDSDSGVLFAPGSREWSSV